MKENITNNSKLEEALQTELSEHQVHHRKSEAPRFQAVIDEAPLPKGMREKVETVEVSTFKPKA